MGIFCGILSISHDIVMDMNNVISQLFHMNMLSRLKSTCDLTLSTKFPLAHEGLEILAFPSNDFGNMEPGSNKEILEFARSKYKATFPIFAKVGSLALETFRVSLFGDIDNQFWSPIVQKELNRPYEWNLSTSCS